MRRFQFVVAVLLTLCLGVFVVRTVHWPLVSDAALVRYATFLMNHGWAPYRQIQDYNLPGTYLVDWLVVHTLGPSDIAWRGFDLLLLAAAGIAMMSIAWPSSRFAGLFGFSLFALFHGRDGIAHTGQRDLTLTVIALLAAALLLRAARRREGARGSSARHAWIALSLFGLLVGGAATIKPVALLLLALPLLPGLAPLGSAWKRLLVPAFAALIPMGGALAWIVRLGVFSAFRFIVLRLLPLHQELGYPGARYLVSRCLTASHGALLGIGLVLSVSRGAGRKDGQGKAQVDWTTRTILLAGILFGFISYFAQAKGYPYHRYPFAAFLFLFVGLECTAALDAPGKRYLRLLAAVGLLFGAVLAPLYTLHAVRERWPANPYTSLAADLRRLDAIAPLAHEVQCIDTISGCIATLNALGLIPATGFFYDEFLFPTKLNPEQAATVTRVRGGFFAALASHPPRVLIVTSFLFPRGPDDYAKLAAWPAFRSFLDRCYTVDTERTFAVPPQDPTRGYRLYLRRPQCTRQ